MFPPARPGDARKQEPGLPAAHSRPPASPVHRPAAAAAPGAGKQPPSPRTGCGRASPPPVAAGDAAAGAHTNGQAKETSLHRPLPRGSAGRTSKNGGGSEGLILRRKAAAALPAAPRGRYITAARGRAGRRAPLRWGNGPPLAPRHRGPPARGSSANAPAPAPCVLVNRIEIN